MAASDRGFLRDASVHLERATAVVVNSPADFGSFSAHLEAAVTEMRRVPDAPPAELAMFRARLTRLTHLVHSAEAFYGGWAALAGVSASDPIPPSISIQA